MRILLLFVMFLFAVTCILQCKVIAYTGHSDDPFWLDLVPTPSFADTSDQDALPVNKPVVKDEAPIVIPVAEKKWIATHLVVYSAKWCSPCQKVKPKFLKLKELGYRVVIRDYDKLPRKEYRPKAVPEIHLFDNATLKKGHGLTPFSSLEKFAELLELPSSKDESSK